MGQELATKKIFLTLFFPLFLWSFEVSEDIFMQLEETKKLLEEKRVEKARESLDYMLEWFGDELNPLEKDLISYFQGEIYLLQNRKALAISSFSEIIKNSYLDKELLDEVIYKLSKLYLASGNGKLALKYISLLEKNRSENGEVITLKYLIYKYLENYQEAYNYILKMVDRNRISIWKEYFELSVRLDKKVGLEKLLKSITKENFHSFLETIQEFPSLKFERAFLILQGMKLGVEISEDEVLKGVRIFKNYLDFVNARALAELYLQTKQNREIEFLLAELNFKDGEFLESLKILKKLEREKDEKRIHFLRGKIFNLQGKTQEAKWEFRRAE